MTFGSCLDFIEEYIEQNDSKKKDKKHKTRKATQADFDAF